MRDRLHEARRNDGPADADRGREQRARTAHVGDVLGGQRLQCSRRDLVVPEVRVVVVLDDEPVPGGGPVDERAPAFWSEGDSEGELMIGADDHRGDVGDLIQAETVVVDGNRHDLEAGSRDRVRAPAVTWIFDTDTPCATGAEDRREDEQCL